LSDLNERILSHS